MVNSLDINVSTIFKTERTLKLGAEIKEHTTLTAATPGRQHTMISNIDLCCLLIIYRRKGKLKALSVNKY